MRYRGREIFCLVLEPKDVRVTLAGAHWNVADHDGGAGGKGVVDGFRDENREIMVFWKNTRNLTNHVWGHIKTVGRAVDIFVGDVVVRGSLFSTCTTSLVLPSSSTTYSYSFPHLTSAPHAYADKIICQID